MEIRDVLIYFAAKYEGDYDEIYNAIKNKEVIKSDEINETLDKINCSCLTVLDKDYPSSLKNIYKPPFVLFYYGDISIIKKEKKLSVVGTRHPSLYGKNSSEKILNDLLKEEDCVIVSGLALGIDSLAHQIALNNKRKTIAVLANGIEGYYLKSNYELYNKIRKEGLIISEYPFDLQVKKENFRIRNRLIAGLSDVIFVPEANIKSGTMITVKYALESNKDILCMPTNIDAKNTLTNFLIKEGAKLVDSYLDILEEL